MSKGPSFLFEIERSSRQRVVQIERVHCISIEKNFFCDCKRRWGANVRQHISIIRRAFFNSANVNNVILMTSMKNRHA